jgi:hypothetical protein
MDSGDLVVKFAPMIAGAALLAAFILDFVRNQKLSALSALIPVLGAVLIMAPVLASFTLKGSGFEISANIRGQIGEQGAELKRQLADLRNEVEQARSGSASGTGSSSPSLGSRAPSVLIYYVDGQKPLALKLEDYLLHNGYASNAVYTDFSELDMKEAPGTVRFAFTKSSQDLAKKLESTLQSLLPANTPIVDRYREVLGSGDVQIQLF